MSYPSPQLTTRGLRRLFPTAKFGSELIVHIENNVVTGVTSPRPVTEAEILTAAMNTPVVPREIAKLTIRRRLRALGKEELFDAALDVIPHARRDYDDAQVLNITDPIFTTAAPLLKAQLGLTDEQFTALLAP